MYSIAPKGENLSLNGFNEKQSIVRDIS